MPPFSAKMGVDSEMGNCRNGGNPRWEILAPAAQGKGEPTKLMLRLVTNATSTFKFLFYLLSSAIQEFWDKKLTP